MLTCHPGIRGPFPKILPLLVAALRTEGCDVVEEPWGRHHDQESFFEKIRGRMGDLARLWRRLRQEKFDVLVIQTTTEWRNYSRDIPALWLARRCVPHLVVQFHGSTPEIVLGAGYGAFKRATRSLLRLTDGVIVSSSEEQRAWQKFYPQGRWFTARNPFVQVEVKRSNVATPPPWVLPDNTPNLLFVGRLIVEKGIFDLLEALSGMNGETRFHLLVIGSGPAEEEFKAKVQSLGLKDKVTIAGHVDETALRCAYQSANVFVLPSWSEGLPTVLLEAMDAGLPIVTTRIRGAADHLKEDVHACLVPPRNPPKLAEALAKVIASDDLRSRMGKANRDKIREFAPDATAREYLMILHQIADSKSQDIESIPALSCDSEPKCS